MLTHSDTSRRVSQAHTHASRDQIGRSIWYSGYLLTLLAAGAETDGRFAIVEEVGRKGQSADTPLHVHSREQESFYIIEGEMRFYVGDQVLDAAAGSLVVLPPHVPHRFTIESDDVRMLNICTPAGFEGFFLDLSEPAQAMTLPPAPSGAPDIPKIIATAARYGVEILPPPHEPRSRRPQ